VKGHEYGYRIHLIYGAEISATSYSRGTINDSIDDIEMSWDYDAIPVIPEDEDYDPYSEIIIDSTLFSKESMAALEAILYGTDTEDPRMPDLEELLDLFSEEEPIPEDWTGFPHDLLYPSETIYPSDLHKVDIVASLAPGTTIAPGESCSITFAWENLPDYSVIVGTDYTAGITEEIENLRFTYTLSENQDEFVLVGYNETDENIVISKETPITFTLSYVIALPETEGGD
jgi:hypothetical protein